MRLRSHLVLLVLAVLVPMVVFSSIVIVAFGRQQRAAVRDGAVETAALTAYGRTEDRVLSLTAGYSMHVPKPVDPGECTTVIASLAGRAHSPAE